MGAHVAPLGSVQQAKGKAPNPATGKGTLCPKFTYSHHPAGAAQGPRGEVA